MAHLTEGRTNFFIGAGEMKNCQPFGFRRGEGLKRLEDALRMSREFWDSDGPVSIDGRVSKLDRVLAAQVQAFLDAGVSYAGLADYLPLVSPPGDHDSLVTDTNRSVACFRHLTRNRDLTAVPTSVEE